MTAQNQAAAAYGRLLGTTASPKRGEYQVIARITARLHAAAQDNPPLGARAAALHENRKLWIEIGTQVADEDNGLPMELRQRLFALSVYVQNYSGKVLKDGASLAPLVELNQRIMAGLQTSKGAAA